MTQATAYVPGRSWLYTLDPRVKLWFALLGMLLCGMTGNFAVLTGLLVVVHLILLSGDVRVSTVGRAWLTLLPVLSIILVLQPLLVGGDGPVFIALGPVTVTQEGALTGVRYVLRMSGAAFAVLVPVLTTPMNNLIRAMQKVGLPYNWALTIGLALRYLGTLGTMYTTISEAQQARGWDLSTQRFWKRARAAVPTLIALIVASLRLSDALALGLAARGFGKTSRRTYLYDLRMRSVDWLALAVVTAGFASVMILVLTP